MKKTLLYAYQTTLRIFMFFYVLLLGNKTRINGLAFIIPNECDPLTFFKLILNRYERSEIKLLKYLNSGDGVIELGGSIGVVSNLINKKIENKESHIVIEPNPLAIYYSEINKSINNSGYKILMGAIGEEKTTLINISKDFLGSSGFVKYNNHAYTTSVNCISLNSIIKILQRYDRLVLIMDIEGAESIVVRDDSLKKCDLIIMERHPNILKEKDSIIDKEMAFKGFELMETIENVEVWGRNLSKSR